MLPRRHQAPWVEQGGLDLADELLKFSAAGRGSLKPELKGSGAQASCRPVSRWSKPLAGGDEPHLAEAAHVDEAQFPAPGGSSSATRGVAAGVGGV